MTAAEVQMVVQAVVAGVGLLVVAPHTAAALVRRHSVDGGSRPGSRLAGAGRRWPIPTALRDGRHGRRSVETDLADLAAVCDAVVRRLRVGDVVASALDVASADAPTGTGLPEAAASVRAGGSWPVALSTWSASSPRNDGALGEARAMVAATATMALTVGGPATDAFASLAAGLRDRVEVAAEVVALTAQARASAALVGGLPIVGAVGGSILDPRFARFLAGTPSGWAVAVAGLTLDGLGWWWLRRLAGGVA